MSLLQALCLYFDPKYRQLTCETGPCTKNDPISGVKISGAELGRTAELKIELREPHK